MDIENPMVLPRYEYNTDYEKYYEALAEKSDAEWEDNCGDD